MCGTVAEYELKMIGVYRSTYIKRQILTDVARESASILNVTIENLANNWQNINWLIYNVQHWARDLGCNRSYGCANSGRHFKASFEIIGSNQAWLSLLLWLEHTRAKIDTLWLEHLSPSRVFFRSSGSCSLNYSST